MIRINNLRIDVAAKNKNKILEEEILKKLKIKKDELLEWTVNKKSIDARRKNKINYQYSIDVEVVDEDKVLKRINYGTITKVKEKNYSFKPIMDKNVDKPPIVIGAGPAGLFCALLLAEYGLKPIVIEQGKKVEERVEDINLFWNKGILNEKSNVQFGEGGAGTFSDGKLTTLIKDKENRSSKIIKEFIEAGAPKEISYIKNPHIGTDNLRRVVINLRRKIEELGGSIFFEEVFKDIVVKNNKVYKVVTNSREFETDNLVLAVGHSSRNTFYMLEKYLRFTPKPFSIGVRIEHPREDIDRNQYGKLHRILPAAEYKLVSHYKDRSTYTFCMCPGGLVVGSSSEKNSVVTNGMSNFKRNEKNSNSALLVNIRPEDYFINSPLDGINFQRKWERLAFELGGRNYKAPVQLFGDLKEGRITQQIGDVKPSYKPGYEPTDLRECLPNFVVENIIKGIDYFGTKIKNFDRYDAVLTGVETRSSSPLRIDRDDNYQSNIEGIYPCGEGAGYSGGIMSSAIDGLKIAEKIIELK
jgi:uncharacterized FAD-dependent dehydrogenase